MAKPDGNAKIKKSVADELIKEMFGEWGLENMTEKVGKEGIPISDLLDEIFHLHEKQDEVEEDDVDDDDESSSEPKIEYIDSEHIDAPALLNQINNLVLNSQKKQRPDPFCKTKIERDIICYGGCEDCPMRDDLDEDDDEEDEDDDFGTVDPEGDKIYPPMDTVSCIGVFPCEAQLYDDETVIVSSLRGPKMCYKMNASKFYDQFLVLNSIKGDTIDKAPKEFFNVSEEAVEKLNSGDEHIHFLDEDNAVVEVEALNGTKGKYAISNIKKEHITKPEMVASARDMFESDIRDHLEFTKDWAINGLKSW